jgi:hypothetical protein
MIIINSENMTQLGPHTLSLQVIVSESSTVPVMKGLPSHRFKFTVTGIADCQ